MCLQEWFYQWKGDMCLRIAHHSEDPVGHTGTVTFEDVIIKEGQMFLLPGNTPHSPQRFPDTIGLVIERIRTEANVYKLRWYCEACGTLVHQDAFHCKDIVGQLKDVMVRYANDPALRTCPSCGHLNPTK
jgi:3-hydroxyanthranilate 3,4-dioxygenase